MSAQGQMGFMAGKGDSHSKGCELGDNWKDCPACVETNVPKPMSEPSPEAKQAVEIAAEIRRIKLAFPMDDGRVERLEELARQIEAIDTATAKLREEIKRQAVCLNCGVIQHDQIDRICTTCNRADLMSLKDLLKILAHQQPSERRKGKTPLHGRPLDEDGRIEFTQPSAETMSEPSPEAKQAAEEIERHWFGGPLFPHAIVAGEVQQAIDAAITKLREASAGEWRIYAYNEQRAKRHNSWDIRCGEAEIVHGLPIEVCRAITDAHDAATSKLREELAEGKRIKRLSNQLYTALREDKPIPLGFRLCDEVQHILDQRDRLQQQLAKLQRDYEDRDKGA